jgi:hypothetical protein
MQGFVQACGERIRGAPFVAPKAGPQFCGEALRGQAFNRTNAPVTDVCGIPLPCSRTPTVVLQPTCYSLPGFPEGCSLPGYARITVNADCTGERGIIVDEDNTPIPSAVEVPCSQRSGLPVRPVVPGP